MTSKTKKLHLRLFGAFSAKWSDDSSINIRGNKQRALIAVLATAAGGKHTRGWLQETLWGRSGAKHGRANLRRMLSDLKSIFAADFERLFVVDHADIQLNIDLIKVEGDHRDGEFLAGVDIWEEGFRSWVYEKREQSKQTSSITRIELVDTLPTVTIIPFLSIRQNDIERHLSDLLALEVSRALSRSTMINVISHLSSREFSGKSLSLKEVKQNLHIDYLATGTMRVDGQTFSVDVDFLNASDGKIIWTQNFTGCLDDIFKNQRGAPYEIANQVGQGVLSASVELAKSQPLPNIQSHALLMSAINWLHSNDSTLFLKSKDCLLELADTRRVKDSRIHAWLAFWNIISITQGWSDNAVRSKSLAIESANRALDLNPFCAFSLTMEGMVRNSGADDQRSSLQNFENAIEVEPNNPMAWLFKARHHAFTDENELAVKVAQRALTLSPIGPQQYLFYTIAATAHLATGDYAYSLDLVRQSLASNSTHKSSLRVKTIALELSGKHREAHQTIDQILEIDPSFSVEKYINEHFAAHSNNGKIWSQALKSAGLPLN